MKLMNTDRVIHQEEKGCVSTLFGQDVPTSNLLQKIAFLLLVPNICYS